MRRNNMEKDLIMQIKKFQKWAEAKVVILYGIAK